MGRKFLSFVGPVLIICFLGFVFVFSAQANEEKHVCIVYFSGIGCPRCALADPVILEQLPREYQNLVIIDYEFYQQSQNAPLIYEYHSKYSSGWKNPLIILNQEQHFEADREALKSLRGMIEELDYNECPLIDGSSQDFSDLNLTSLPGYPKIWYQEKILMKMGPEGDGELLKKLLVSDDLAEILEGIEFKPIEPIEVGLSGKDLKFDNGILIDDWIFQWNGEGIGISPSQVEILPELKTPPPAVTKPSLSMAKIVTLAAVDAVNPCAFAVLLLMLTTVIAYNPGNRRRILLSGVAFITSVFILYFIYGLVIIKFFQVVQALTQVRIWIFKGLGVAAIVFGVLNIRDFVRYKPGRLGTEMPLFMRPRVQKILSRITSVRGASLVGIFVTLFLLPCTIGPYVIAGGILSVFEMMENIPPLLLYNLIFILPMMAIVGGVYLGLGRVEDVASWKERNIGKLHLVAGSLILGLGIAMTLGLV